MYMYMYLWTLYLLCALQYNGLHHGSSIEISYDERQRNIRQALVLAMDLNWDWLWKSEMHKLIVLCRSVLQWHHWSIDVFQYH